MSHSHPIVTAATARLTALEQQRLSSSASRDAAVLAEETRRELYRLNQELRGMADILSNGVHGVVQSTAVVVPGGHVAFETDFVNDALRTMVGCDRGSVAGRSLSEVLPVTDTALLQAVCESVYKSGEWQELDLDGASEAATFQVAVWPNPGGIMLTVQDVGARRRTERKTVHSRRLLRSILDATTHGVMGFDAVRNDQGAIVDLVCRVANLSALRSRPDVDGLVGMRLTELWPFTAENGLLDKYVGVIDTGVGIRFRHLTEEGLTYELSAEPWSDGCVVTFDDVSDQVERQQELQEQRIRSSRLARALNHSGAGVVLLDSAYRIDWKNKYFSKMVGHDETTFDLRTHIPTGQLATYTRDLNRRGVWRSEISIRTRTGEHRYLVEMRAINDVETVGGYIGVFADVTKQRRTEMALRRDNELLSNLLANLPDLVCWRDRDLVLRGCNPPFAAAVGLAQASDVHGLSDDRLPHPATREDLTELGALLNSPSSDTILREQSFTHATLGERTMRHSAILLRDDGHVTGILEIRTDVTDERLAEGRREQASKLQSIGQLAAGIAHEINTPIQYASDNLSFLGSAFEALRPYLAAVDEAVASGQEVEQQLAALDAVALLKSRARVDMLMQEIPLSIKETSEGLGRVATIVRAMKDFAHPSQGQLVDTDVRGVIETTIAVASSEWKYVADVSVDVQSALPQVPLIRDQFSQVLLNLLVNAAHAIAETQRPEKGNIRVRACADDEWMRLFVQDDGAGIPPEVASRIFDPFFTTKEVGRGTGQGLAMAYDVVVNKHAGSIEASPVDAGGTVFSLAFPLKRTA